MMPFSDPIDKIEAGQVVGSGVFVDEMDRPCGERKMARVEKAKLVRKRRRREQNYGGREERSSCSHRYLSSLLVLMNKYVDPEHVMDSAAKLFVDVKSVKLGKMRPNQKLRRIFNGWIKFFGVCHCRRALREIEQSKIPGLK